MSLPEKKVIYLSKIKIMLLVISSILLVGLGVWLLTLDGQSIENSRRFNSPILVQTIAILSIVFFGIWGIFGTKKLFDKTPGLILSSKGIFDNSSGVSAGMIPWSEVVDIRQYQIHRHKFVAILVRDPEKYVNKGGVLKRMANRANQKMSGTPINISANALQISYDELYITIRKYYHNSCAGE